MLLWSAYLWGRNLLSIWSLGAQNWEPGKTEADHLSYLIIEANNCELHPCGQISDISGWNCIACWSLFPPFCRLSGSPPFIIYFLTNLWLEMANHWDVATSQFDRRIGHLDFLARNIIYNILETSFYPESWHNKHARHCKTTLFLQPLWGSSTQFSPMGLLSVFYLSIDSSIDPSNSIHAYISSWYHAYIIIYII
jgi:hypothetical protein